MKRTLIAVVLTLGLASSAWGASLDLQVHDVNGGGPGPIAPGDSFVLHLVAGITNADPITLGLDVRVLGDGAVSWTGAQQTLLTSFGGLNWTEFSTICSGGDPCVAVNQGNPVLPAGAAADEFNGIIATITGIANAGAAGIRLEIPAGSSFFGLTGDAGVAPITIVPEPTTVALMGLGLLGLGAAGRRR